MQRFFFGELLLDELRRQCICCIHVSLSVFHRIIARLVFADNAFSVAYVVRFSKAPVAALEFMALSLVAMMNRHAHVIGVSCCKCSARDHPVNHVVNVARSLVCSPKPSFCVLRAGVHECHLLLFVDNRLYISRLIVVLHDVAVVMKLLKMNPPDHVVFQRFDLPIVGMTSLECCAQVCPLQHVV